MRGKSAAPQGWIWLRCNCSFLPILGVRPEWMTEELALRWEALPAAALPWAHPGLLALAQAPQRRLPGSPLNSLASPEVLPRLQPLGSSEKSTPLSAQC